MSMKKLSKEVFETFVDGLISSGKVYGVQAKSDKSDKFDFAKLCCAKCLRLDYDVTIQPPKKFFQPPVETLMTYKAGETYESVHSDEKFVVIGVHPYDMAAINQMDVLFSQDEYDTHYMTRRKNATIIACDVANASKNVFASSMKTATVEAGFDILLTDVGDGYVAQAATEKGEALLASAEGAIDASDEDVKKREKVQEDNKKNLNNHELKCDCSDLPKLLDKAYDHAVWEEQAKTCFNCGSCNQVCPTCYCFDVKDDMDWSLKGGKRERCWDGCLLDGFTKVAGEHEFRKARADRFRHRLYRKGKYVPTKIGGEIACVGCGRCVSACLPDIANPVTVYNKLLDDISID